MLKTFEPVRKLLVRFESAFGSTNCRDLIKCDLETEEGQIFFKKNYLREQCTLFTQQAAGLTLSLIEEYLGETNP